MIHKLRITKPATQWEYEQLMRIHWYFRPRQVEFDVDVIMYDYVDGVPATNVMAVWHAANAGLWEYGSEREPMEVNGYINYVLNRTPVRYVSKVTSYLTDNLKDLTPVAICHGDMTMYNAIQSGDNIVFIDPSPCHGLPCREMDESKMMQSLDGFGTLFRGLPNVDAWPRFRYKPAHFALLLTHYIRMLPHVTDDANAFALQRIEELLCTRTS